MIKFPYLLKGTNYFPVLRLTIKHDEKTLQTDALIDSGASVSVFQAAIAKVFGISVKKGELVILETINGKVTANIHEFPVIFGDFKFNCKVAYSEELTTGFNILGRDNFFRFFKITFDELNKEIILGPNNLLPG